MPGVLPEQDVIEGEDEMSEEERAILKDLEESLPADAREGAEPEPAEAPEAPAPIPATEAVAASSRAAPATDESRPLPSATVVPAVSAPSAATEAQEPEKPVRKPFLPWWLAVLVYGGIGGWAVYSGATRDLTTLWRVLFVGLGLYMLWGAYESFRDRNKWKGTVANPPTEQPTEAQKPEQPQSPP